MCRGDCRGPSECRPCWQRKRSRIGAVDRSDIAVIEIFQQADWQVVPPAAAASFLPCRDILVAAHALQGSLDTPLADHLRDFHPDRGQAVPEQLEQNFACGRRHGPNFVSVSANCPCDSPLIVSTHSLRFFQSAMCCRTQERGTHGGGDGASPSSGTASIAAAFCRRGPLVGRAGFGQGARDGSSGEAVQRFYGNGPTL